MNRCECDTYAPPRNLGPGHHMFALAALDDQLAIRHPIYCLLAEALLRYHAIAGPLAAKRNAFGLKPSKGHPAGGGPRGKFVITTLVWNDLGEPSLSYRRVRREELVARP